jgi:hypothetical protein
LAAKTRFAFFKISSSVLLVEKSCSRRSYSDLTVIRPKKSASPGFISENFTEMRGVARSNCDASKKLTIGMPSAFARLELKRATPQVKGFVW